MTRSARQSALRLRTAGSGTLTAAAVALALGGCGGSGGKSVASRPSATTAPLTTSSADPPTPPTTPPHKPKGTKAGGAGPAGVHPLPHRPHGARGHLPPAPSLGPVLTAAQLRQKATAACSSASSRENAISRPADFATNAKAAGAYLNQIVSIGQSEIVALHLNAPVDVRARYVRFFGDLLHEDLLVILAQSGAMAGRRGYAQQYQAAQSFRQQTLAPAARELGLTDCAA